MEKAKSLHNLQHLFIFVFILLHSSEQLPESHLQVLLQIQRLFDFPPVLNRWNEDIDFCNIDPNPSLTLVCYEDNITQIYLSGHTGFVLPQSFSTASFFTSLAALPSLKVLSLVSLGFGGPLPPTIGGLSSLEILNLSSNYFTGNIPLELSSLKSLQTLALDNGLFTGYLPDWLCSLPDLAVLSLKNNSLNGTLPDCLSKSQNLRILALSKNHLQGRVPDLHELTNLQVLDLQDNNLGPHFPRLHNKLITVVARKNKFRFGFSENLTSNYQLHKLDVSLNDFVGPFFPSLFSLPLLSYLDISENKFTGRLFENISCNSELSFVNLSSNRLTGDLPSCLHSDSKSRTVLYYWNCLSQGEQKQHPPSFCHNEALAVTIPPHKQKEKRANGKAVLALSMAGGFVGGIAFICMAFFIVRREYAKQVPNPLPTRQILEKVTPVNTLKLLKDARCISETMKIMRPHSLPPFRTFSLEELREATNNFHLTNLIGEGSHGLVYKGSLTDGNLVAIRSLSLKRRHSYQGYYRQQIELISKLRHCHLVSSIGHCLEYNPDDPSMSRVLLVFEFVPNGTLRSFVSEGLQPKKLTWNQRMTAAIGIARGIQFLHTGIVPGIFSNHLKITDVLLDHDLRVKISRYNLPLLADNKRKARMEVSSGGSKYKEEPSLIYKDKNDVYDFGVILLEILVGRNILTANDIQVSKDILLVSLAADEIARRNIVDPAIRNECSDESMRIVADLCVRCLSDKQEERPSIEDVLWKLQFAAQLQDSWRRDTISNNQGSSSTSISHME